MSVCGTRDTTRCHAHMAMTLRLTEDDDRALADVAAREKISKHEVVLRALRAYTAERDTRLQRAIMRVVDRDSEALDRLGKA